MAGSRVAPVRIGIIGAGAIGGFYGVMLARAGHDVHFLLRSEFAAVQAAGWKVESAVHGSLDLPRVQACQSIDEMPVCDWLLVAAKTTSNTALAPLLNQAAASGARIVLLQNGLGVEAALRPLLDDNLHLLGGLCSICVHRQAPGVIVHQSLGQVSLGYHSGPASTQAEREILLEEGADLFRSAGLEASTLASLEQGRWQKLVWNVPYNGLAVLLEAGTSALMDNPDSRALILSLMEEVVSAAEACGHSMPEGYPQRLLRSTDRMPDYLPSMVHDFRHGRGLELQAIYEAPLRAAEAAGCLLPRVRMLLQALHFIDRRNCRENGQ